MNIREAVAHPLENKVAVTFQDGNTTRMLWYDMKTGAKLGEHPLPPRQFENFDIAPDGTFFTALGSDGKIYIGNLQRPD